MKSQEQIRYENTCYNLAMGDYRSYSKGSIGWIIHYLRGYGLLQYDIVQVGDGEVTLWGELLATFEVSDDHEYPLFTFMTDKYSHAHVAQINYQYCFGKYENPVNRILESNKITRSWKQT